MTLLTHSSGSSAASSFSVSAGPIDCTGANLIVVSVSFYNGLSISMSDTSSNTWTALTMYGGAASSTGNDVQLFYCSAPTVSNSQTFTASNSSNSIFATMCVASFSGAAASSPFDVQNGAYPLNTPPMQPGSITPSRNGELIISAICDGTTTSYTIDSGMTVIEDQLYSGGVNYGGAMAYKIQGTAAAINPTWSNGGSTAVTIASFKAAAASLDGWSVQSYQPLITSFPQIISV